MKWSELKEALADWRRANRDFRKLLAQGGSVDREAFFAAMQKAVDAGNRLEALRLEGLQ